MFNFLYFVFDFYGFVPKGSTGMKGGQAVNSHGYPGGLLIRICSETIKLLRKQNMSCIPRKRQFIYFFTQLWFGKIYLSK